MYITLPRLHSSLYHHLTPDPYHLPWTSAPHHSTTIAPVLHCHHQHAPPSTPFSFPFLDHRESKICLHIYGFNSIKAIKSNTNRVNFLLSFMEVRKATIFSVENNSSGWIYWIIVLVYKSFDYLGINNCFQVCVLVVLQCQFSLC
ncbi:unnamed protein product [Lactuca saligna]|uniref:Uncharacterized protein n=1 Tax=Lactuca saligna TaxID=75948 RepID=A0AA36E4S1_LACSI|nr:unnamed protein product [Lactuca saligna]